MPGLPSSRLFACGYSSSMCDQASYCSGIKEQEGNGIQGWFRTRNRRTSDLHRLPSASQTGHNRFKMTVSGAVAALNSRLPQGNYGNRL